MKKLGCILLVDDNVNDNFVHTVTIREAQAAEEVKTARDGLKALEYLRNGKGDFSELRYPDLIFLDINMPGMDGFGFLEQIKTKALGNIRKPVIVVMTNSLDPESEKTAKEKYGNEIEAFANKPLTAEMLKSLIERFFPEKEAKTPRG